MNHKWQLGKVSRAERMRAAQLVLTPAERAWRVICYIDEAGRWPIAGPVWIGVVTRGEKTTHLSDTQRQKKLSMFHDSKQCSESLREELYRQLDWSRDTWVVRFASGHASAKQIDRDGIVAAIRRSIIQWVKALGYRVSDVALMIDGNTDFGLRAKGYLVQTIITWDALVPAISAASIVAKVERDHYMVRAGKRYAHYGFQKHKGYGTAAHYAALEEYGTSIEHRISYLKSLEGNVTRTSNSS